MCSIGPTERWLEHAAWRFAHDMANESALYTGISGSFLREYATHAVRDDVVDRMNLLLGWDTRTAHLSHFGCHPGTLADTGRGGLAPW